MIRRTAAAGDRAARQRHPGRALRLAKEFDIRIILDGAAEAYLVLDQIKAAKCR